MNGSQPSAADGSENHKADGKLGGKPGGKPGSKPGGEPDGKPETKPYPKPNQDMLKEQIKIIKESEVDDATKESFRFFLEDFINDFHHRGFHHR